MGAQLGGLCPCGVPEPPDKDLELPGYTEEDAAKLDGEDEELAGDSAIPDTPADAAAADSLPEGGEETSKQYINRNALGRSWNWQDLEQPDWCWQGDKGEFRSYPPQESIELDRYWNVFAADGNMCLARVTLMGKSAIVDFAEMTATVGSYRPRTLQRKVKKADWLSNTYFFEAFADALLGGGVTVSSDPEQMFDFRYNQDLRQLKDDGRVPRRGGYPYKLPIGWKRFAVNVRGHFDDGDNAWLREDDTGWAVAYHGTAKESLPGILSTGFMVGERQKFAADVGAGIYCANDIAVAQHYSEPKEWKGHFVQIVLQMRVKPSAIRKVTHGTDFEKQYWVINNPEHLRPYGVLIRELPLDEYVTALEAVYGPSLRKEQHPHLPPLKQEIYEKWWPSKR